MAGKQAKTLSARQLAITLRCVGKLRYPDRDRTIILLSTKAGPRAGEIAGLTWPMVLDPQGRIARRIELRNVVAKNGSGRIIPLHPALAQALRRLRRLDGTEGPVIRSERGVAMRASSIVNWFAGLYREVGFEGCSSHSGRRIFITTAARLVTKAGGSLRDVQLLADIGRWSTPRLISTATAVSSTGS